MSMRTRKYPIHNDSSLNQVHVLNLGRDGYPLCERKAFEQYATEQIRDTKLEYRKGKIGWLAVPEPKMYEMGIERDLRVEINEEWIENQ